MSGFVMLPNALLTHYVYFPKFNGNTMMVYVYLKKLENAEWGYAFPSQKQAMADLAISDATFKTQIDTLVNCGLISVGKHKSGSFTNNVYYVYDPIDDANDFFAEYPQAKAIYDAKQATAEKVGRSRRKAGEAYIEKQAQNEASLSDGQAVDDVDISWL